MDNFKFCNTTKIIFGRGMVNEISKEIGKSEKILLTFGGGSVKKNDVYEDVKKALKDYQTVEFWGIESNPNVETIRKAITFAKEEKVSFVLAVGGGSVIDASKLIAVAVNDERDAWDIVKEGANFDIRPLPLGTVLTIPATGSEMNKGSVISNMQTKEKFSFQSYYPKFSVLDPTYTFSLPKYQLACGIADSFIHVMEQYMTATNQNILMDRWAEGILTTLIEQSQNILNLKDDYSSRANFMLSATMALNGFISMGVKQDWATHRIGHEITAITGLTHGHTLAIIYPAMLKVLKNGTKENKLVQYAEKVWGITSGSKKDRINKAIEKTEKFYNSLGLTTTFASANIDNNVKKEVVERFKQRGTKLGENQDIDFAIIEEILSKC